MVANEKKPVIICNVAMEGNFMEIKVALDRRIKFSGESMKAFEAMEKGISNYITEVLTRYIETYQE